MTGAERRLARLLDPGSGCAVMVPIDDSLTIGPTDGLDDMAKVVGAIAAGRPDAVLGYQGQFERHGGRIAQSGWIVHLSASTNLRSPARKRLVGSVEAACAAGADAVSVQVNLSSEFESEMLGSLAETVGAARCAGLPVLVMAYPRGEHADGTVNDYVALRTSDPHAYAAMAAHAVRVAVDLGADLVKTQYTGSAETFAVVVAAASGAPIVIAGGPRISARGALENAHGAVTAGARGVSFGRNVFCRRDPAAMLGALRAVVHDGAGVDEALAGAGLADGPP